MDATCALNSPVSSEVQSNSKFTQHYLPPDKLNFCKSSHGHLNPKEELQNEKWRDCMIKFALPKIFWVRHRRKLPIHQQLKAYLKWGPFGLSGGCQDMAIKDSLIGVTDKGLMPSGAVEGVVTLVGKLSVQPPSKPLPPEQATTVME